MLLDQIKTIIKSRSNIVICRACIILYLCIRNTYLFYGTDQLNSMLGFVFMQVKQ